MWEREMAANIPIPRKLYCSPLTRALQTCEITFKSVIDFAEIKPVILEASSKFVPDPVLFLD